MNISKEERERLAESLGYFKPSGIPLRCALWWDLKTAKEKIRDIILNPPSVTMQELIDVFDMGCSSGLSALAGMLRVRGVEVTEGKDAR